MLDDALLGLGIPFSGFSPLRVNNEVISYHMESPHGGEKPLDVMIADVSKAATSSGFNVFETCLLAYQV